MSAAPLPEKGVIVFDLDDTLYPERDFVRSGFRAVADMIEREAGLLVHRRLEELLKDKQPDPFGAILTEHRLKLDKQLLIGTYRNHQPCLKLAPEVAYLLTSLRSSGQSLGIITDGRSVTQRNKIRALGLEAWMEEILISEEFGAAKPAERIFRHFQQRFAGRQFVYVGNDVAKDFLASNRLGWQTVCVLDQGQNVHPQDFDRVPRAALPHYVAERLA